MRSFLGRFLPQSVRGQFAAIIVVAVIVILSSGSAVESFTEYFDLPAVEDSAAQTDVVATRTGRIVVMVRMLKHRLQSQIARSKLCYGAATHCAEGRPS